VARRYAARAGRDGRVSILVQREFAVAAADQAEFERESREGLWPAFLHFGALMVAYGRWSFGGSGDALVTHTAYVDFEHWHATRPSGAFYQDEAIQEEIRHLRAVYAERNRMVQQSRARIIELDDQVSAPNPFYRKPGQPPAEPPPTFGRGSVLSERTYVLNDGAQTEFLRLSRSLIWPWLESHGGRMVGYGSDPLAPSNEVITLFAFRSLPDWHRLSRPPATLTPPAEVVAAWQQRHMLVQRQWGRLLAVGTDFGTKA
jgi:hypothetical protein